MEFTCGLFLPLATVIAWIMLFHVVGRYRKIQDRILLSLLWCIGIVFYVVIRIYMCGCNDYLFVALDNAELLVGLLVCPLLFLYTRSNVFDGNWHNWYWWLFAPGIIVCLSGTILSFFVGWDRIIEARNGTVGSLVPAPNNILEEVYSFIDVDLFNICEQVMAIVLVGWCIFYLIRYRKFVDDFYSSKENSNSGNLHYFILLSILLMVSLSVIVFCIETCKFNKSILLCCSVWLSFLLWRLSFIAYKTEPEEQCMEMITMDIDGNSTEDKTTEEKKREASIEGVLLQKVIAWQSRKDKPYCREGLTLSDIASDIQVNPRTLSVCINKHFGMNFNRWVNSMRIDEAKRLLRISTEMKIGYVSSVCGFTDQAAFSNTFRSFVGCSPMAYRDSVKR